MFFRDPFCRLIKQTSKHFIPFVCRDAPGKESLFPEKRSDRPKDRIYRICSNDNICVEACSFYNYHVPSISFVQTIQPHFSSLGRLIDEPYCATRGDG